jgi:hypothetical protein
MTWWQSLMVVSGWIICWYMGRQGGYFEGWDDHRDMVERKRQIP